MKLRVSYRNVKNTNYFRRQNYNNIFNYAIRENS